MIEVMDVSMLDEFERLSTYDVKVFMSNYLDFIDNEYSNIINYYSGSSNVAPTVSFSKLNNLIKEQKKIIDIFILNATSMDNYQFWILLEYVEDIGHVLETAKNSNRWLRASVTSNGYKQQIIAEHMTSQGQGLEGVERSIIQSTSFRDSWVETALENGITEEDYDMTGGVLIKIIYKNGSALFLEGVVDALDEPKKTYGLDVNKKIIFENDDLAVLQYEPTIVQCAEILTALEREHDPAYPERGINKKAVVGNSVVGVSYPTIFRELAGSFATDDSFKSLSVVDVRREVDAVLLDFKIETKAGDFFNKTIQL